MELTEKEAIRSGKEFHDDLIESMNKRIGGLEIFRGRYEWADEEIAELEGFKRISAELIKEFNRMLDKGY